MFRYKSLVIFIYKTLKHKCSKNSIFTGLKGFSAEECVTVHSVHSLREEAVGCQPGGDSCSLNLFRAALGQKHKQLFIIVAKKYIYIPPNHKIGQVSFIKRQQKKR